MSTLILPRPTLNEGRFASIPVFTDEALFEASGVRIAFTTREGGVSSGPYNSFNFGSHVEDSLDCVMANRALLLNALYPENKKPLEEVLIVPKQVHGCLALSVECASDVALVQKEADKGADSIVVGTREVAALLCFADCVPVIIVLPTGRFAVVHAGWRGVENTIAAKTLELMLLQEAKMQDLAAADLLAQTNIYIGPYIHRECFETSPEIHQLFVDKFGASCNFDPSHIDLGAALRVQFERLGARLDRIADLDKCTVCNNSQFFSFRAQDGTAGRHGAFAIRL
jgi:hypothetical protein